MRKPLVEKKRRARINESLQELRVLIADADVRCYSYICAPPALNSVVPQGDLHSFVLASLCCGCLLLTSFSFCHPLQLQSKMENAEVLEMTVKRVESILQNRAQGKNYTFMCINQQAVKYFTFHN